MATNTSPTVAEIQARLDAANSDATKYQPYYELYNMMQSNNPNLKLTDTFKQNMPFIKEQASLYQDALKRKNAESKIFDAVNGKYQSLTA
jgi:hypothetical protein